MNMSASRTSAVAALFLTIVGVGTARLPAAQSQVPAANGTDPSRALLTTYCTGCHNQRLRTGGLSLDDADTDTDRRQCRRVGEGRSQAAQRSDAAVRPAAA